MRCIVCGAEAIARSISVEQMGSSMTKWVYEWTCLDGCEGRVETPKRLEQFEEPLAPSLAPNARCRVVAKSAVDADAELERLGDAVDELDRRTR